MINLKTYPAIMGTTIFIATFSTSIVFTYFWSNICWLPRFGGLLVGMAVFIQGYMAVNIEKFSIPWRWGLSREQAYSHFASSAAVFGTLIWAFGDLFPNILWVTNTACTG